MRIFSGLESSLEKYIEGFFKGKFSSDKPIHPTDIAKKLAKAMRDKRRISVSNVYVPNEYHVLLHPSDFLYIQPMILLLTKELGEFLVQNAEDRKYTLVSSPIINFSEQTELEPGDIFVESKFGFSEGGDIPLPLTLAQPENNLKHEETKAYEAFSDTAPLVKLKQIYFASLIVEEGADLGKEFPLSAIRSSIGRRDTCDIVLNDNSISRRHAQIEKNNDGFYISDLNSTNGTHVNGLLIDTYKLASGDVITLGNTVLIFKEL
ncbi:DUF3662 and FHA domain-containing protein [Desulfotomaculum sp. 1211_IL3151]|uniref:DUF3662 and FHA domain-containing protein n=1 Tax=Desulfotomaculum sp. 1211_IL3151 TaxID=3084055 RepID=UPI002FDA78C2